MWLIRGAAVHSSLLRPLKVCDVGNFHLKCLLRLPEGHVSMRIINEWQRPLPLSSHRSKLKKERSKSHNLLACVWFRFLPLFGCFGFLLLAADSPIHRIASRIQNQAQRCQPPYDILGAVLSFSLLMYHDLRAACVKVWKKLCMRMYRSGRVVVIVVGIFILFSLRLLLLPFVPFYHCPYGILL